MREQEKGEPRKKDAERKEVERIHSRVEPQEHRPTMRREKLADWSAVNWTTVTSLAVNDAG